MYSGVPIISRDGIIGRGGPQSRPRILRLAADDDAGRQQRIRPRRAARPSVATGCWGRGRLLHSSGASSAWRAEAARWAEKVQVRPLPASEADEVPLVGEGAVGVALELVEDDAAGRADAERLLEQVHEGGSG
jgi:hypothetical protein